MVNIEDIVIGESYACKFRVKTMLDELGQPASNLTSTPLSGIKEYEGIGVLMQRDTEQRLVKLKDEKSLKEFVVGYDDIWDIDTVDWIGSLPNE